MLCLNSGKHVLCEKPLTINASQARKLYDKAKEKGLFLMEATWTRFFPISIAIRKHIVAGKIGEILRGTADLSHLLEPSQWDVSHRLLNKDLAGGSLMDVGPYPMMWLMQTMWHTLPGQLCKDKPKVIGTVMTMDPRTDVDTMSTVLLEFPRSSPSGGLKAHGVAASAFTVAEDPDGKNTAGAAVRLYGTKGEIQVSGKIHRPLKYKIILHNGMVIEETVEIPAGGHGMFYRLTSLSGVCVMAR